MYSTKNNNDSTNCNLTPLCYLFCYSTAGSKPIRLCSKGLQTEPETVHCSGFCDKHICLWWHSILGSHALNQAYYH